MPNITGDIATNYCGNASNTDSLFTGAFKNTKYKKSNGDDDYANFRHYISYFDASNGETKTDGSLKTDDEYKVYGSSNHVTPNNLSIRIWQRTS